MRLHRNLCFAVIDGLTLIFNEGKYADKVIQQLLKRDKRWGSRDRAFVAETTYDIVRWKRLYAEIADRLGVEKAVVVGASEGGFIASHFAIHYPERIEKLVFTDRIKC